MGITYGYIRVSSAEQNEARQIDALSAAGVDKRRMFIDKKSGKDFNRPEWIRLRHLLQKGDLLVVQSLDRLGRNYGEIQDEWRDLVRDKGVDIRVLNMPILDTTNSTRGLIGRFVADIVLGILAFVAENERHAIRERQRQGIAAAKARGKRFGAPEKPLPDNFDKIFTQWSAHAISLRKAALACHVSRETFKKWINQTSLQRQQ